MKYFAIIKQFQVVPNVLLFTRGLNNQLFHKKNKVEQ